MLSNDLFWNSSIRELKNGFIFNKKTQQYTCIMCGKSFLNGKIYPSNGEYIDARLAVKNHITQKHSSSFEYLITMDKRYNGLSDTQKTIVSRMFAGAHDGQIAKEMGNKASSTIRNHRFTLREKYKEAKVFIAIMELLHEKKDNTSEEKFIHFHNNMPITDGRIMVTEAEQQKVLSKYFTGEGILIKFPKKEKEKLVTLQKIITNFEEEKRYSEKEVNEILKRIYLEDYVTVRRYLIEYKFMERKSDCSEYWVKS